MIFMLSFCQLFHLEIRYSIKEIHFPSLMAYSHGMLLSYFHHVATNELPTFFRHRHIIMIYMRHEKWYSQGSSNSSLLMLVPQTPLEAERIHLERTISSKQHQLGAISIHLWVTKHKQEIRVDEANKHARKLPRPQWNRKVDNCS